MYLDNAEESARLDAVSAAERMGISLTVIDVKRELEENVCRPFTEAYLRGETPEPLHNLQPERQVQDAYCRC